ncbi:MAG: hypothetical protein PHP00_08370 [Thiotrichaceae bacterium]|jgi:hypothetical protein|nr:hypothetical protein [Thiotrichaceae bacterium]
MFEERVRIIIQEKFEELVDTAIDELKALNMEDVQNRLEEGCKLDTHFENFWAAFVEELQQGAESMLYHTFIELIDDMCLQLIQELSITELKLMWLTSDGCLSWEEPAEFPEIEQMARDVSDELLSWIEQEAEEPEFASEEDEGENNFDLHEGEPKYLHH